MKRREKQKSEVDNQFKNLVTNAFDFLSKSVEEIDTSPKHTIIDFYTAVELFVKARLMKEHWSLILMRPEQANAENFLKGDFQSVSLKAAKERLENIIGQDDIGKDAYECFREIGNHRNRLVHFHNKSSKLKELVAKEVLKGFYFLYVLLKKKWTLYFKNYDEKLELISRQAHKLRDFLETKFEILKPEIEQEIVEGTFYSHCLSCGFEAAKKTQIHNHFFGFYLQSL